MGCIVPGCVRALYAKGYCNAHYLAARKYPGETPEQLAARNKRPRTDDEMRAMILSRFVPVLRVPDLGECHEWTGAKDRHGYGHIRWGTSKGKLWGAHRLAFHLFVHPVEPKMDVCHACDNPPCIRREHLFYGTHRENMLDASAKGLMAGNGGMNGSRNGRAVLTPEAVQAIRATPKVKGSETMLARRFGVSVTTITRARSGRTHFHGI